jgi:hypothetical protein
MLWDCETESAVWRSPPFGEELYDHSLDVDGDGYNKFEGQSSAKDPATAALRWQLFFALKGLVQGDSKFELQGGRYHEIKELAGLGLTDYSDDSGVPRVSLPGWMETKLNSTGLLPPLHSEVSKLLLQDHSSEATQEYFKDLRSSESISGLSWPRPLSSKDFLMHSLEPTIKPGDVVEVEQRGSWFKCPVVSVVPRVTLRNEIGAALVLKIFPGLGDRADKHDDLIHIPSRIWPEGDSSRMWSWRITK